MLMNNETSVLQDGINDLISSASLENLKQVRPTKNGSGQFDKKNTSIMNHDLKEITTRTANKTFSNIEFYN